MTNSAVIGLGFGDEGKGLVTDYLCSEAEAPLVVRFSGGHQAGHTVVHKGIRHIFSSYGSGTLRGAPTYWSKYCTVSPTNLRNETEVLIEKGIKPLLFIHANCPVTTPFDTEYNRDQDKLKKHGTCGLGFGATIEREENFYSLHFIDLFYPEILKLRLDSIYKYYSKNKRFKLEYFNKLEAHLENFYSGVEYIKKSPFIKLSANYDNKCSNYIFEGSQGLLLDQHNGFFPNVTRSNIGLENIKDIFCSKKDFSDLNLFLVTRAYQTRHGNGYMTNENIPHNIQKNPLETNKPNRFQGEFRRSLLDASLLEYAISRNNIIKIWPEKNLVITCLDHVEEDGYRLTYRGEILKCHSKEHFAETVGDIIDIKNIYISTADDSKYINKIA